MVAIEVAEVGLRVRLYGLGSVYGKTIRDSRLAVLLVALLTAGLVSVAGAATSAAFATPEARRELAALATTLPALFQGFYGRPLALETLGGIIEWRYPVILFLIAPVWSIVALSATLASEARRGSLELVLVTPATRRRVALEKVGGHLTMVALIALVVAVATWFTGAAFATLPGDAISVQAAFAFGLLTGLLILVPGAIAFALAPLLGRGMAAGIAAALMVVAYLVNGFQSAISGVAVFTPLSWYTWVDDHIPLAGRYDWASLVPLVLLAAVLLAVGVVAFDRRDVGSTVPFRSPHMPRSLVGLRGPISRSFSERLPVAMTWGIGIGLYALVLATSSQSLADAIHQNPVLDELMRNLFPTLDYASPGGVLQLVFLEFAFLVFGFAAVTIVAGWASDETSGRLELLLSTPRTRARWAIESGLGAYLSIVVLALVVAAGIAIGAVAVGGDAITPALGMLAPAVFTAALAGVGFAVGGLLRASWAAPAVAFVTLATFLIDLFVPALKLPDSLHELALSTHLGRPMVGEWDIPGMLLCLGIAAAGLAVGAWGMARRDLRS